jgi:hypothetical protein
MPKPIDNRNVHDIRLKEVRVKFGLPEYDQEAGTTGKVFTATTYIYDLLDGVGGAYNKVAKITVSEPPKNERPDTAAFLAGLAAGYGQILAAHKAQLAGGT